MLGHQSSSLFFRQTRGHFLAVLVEHAQEAIVGGGLTLVIPFLSMANDLMCVVELKGEKRIDDLGHSVN